LYWDLLTTLPWDQIVLAAAGLAGSNSQEARYIGLLSLLRLVSPRGRRRGKGGGGGGVGARGGHGGWVPVCDGARCGKGSVVVAVT
jgi:hypothetical protein